MIPLIPSVRVCLYCGRPTRGARTCPACKPLLALDPLYSPAIHSNPNATTPPRPERTTEQ